MMRIMAMIIGGSIGIILGCVLIPFVNYFFERIWNAEEKLISKIEKKRYKKMQKKLEKKFEKRRLTEKMIIKIEKGEE